jgi:hypothetical protein
VVSPHYIARVCLKNKSRNNQFKLPHDLIINGIFFKRVDHKQVENGMIVASNWGEYVGERHGNKVIRVLSYSWTEKFWCVIDQ